MTRGTDPHMQELAFRAIERAANAGERCPSNIQLARLLGLASCGGSSAVVSRLEEAGLIKVERFGSSRRVTIVATGRSTYCQKRSSNAPAPPTRISRQPSMPRKRPDMHLPSATGQTRAEQIRAECAAEAAARLDRSWAHRATSGLTGIDRQSRLDAEEGVPEVKGSPCFRCGAGGGRSCEHRDLEWALHG